MEKQKNIPQLRFPEFFGDWDSKMLGEIYKFKVTNSFSRADLNYEYGDVMNIHYGDIHTQFETLFDIEKERVPYINVDIIINKISDENYCKEGDLIFADASEDYNDIGKSIEIINLKSAKVLSGLHTILARPEKKSMAVGYAGYLMKSPKIRLQIQKEAQGTKVLSISSGRLSKININFPTIPEQQKIASFFTAIDHKISRLKQKKTLLEQYKKGVMQKIFSQEIRFKNDNGQEFPKWEKTRLGDCLDYLQPTMYIVKSTEYDDSFSIPVLTAGKSFILGYSNEEDNVFIENLPVIIFDDFTTSSQYVDFPFKVKSSAMKILIAKESVHIKFIYEALNAIKYEVGGHERHWISKFAPMEIEVPTISEQAKIANFLSAIDNKITYTRKQIDKAGVWKKGLMQQMFV